MFKYKCLFCNLHHFFSRDDIKEHLEDFHEIEMDMKDMSMEHAIRFSTIKKTSSIWDEEDEEKEEDDSSYSFPLMDISKKDSGFGGFGGGGFSGGGASGSW